MPPWERPRRHCCRPASHVSDDQKARRTRSFRSGVQSAPAEGPVLALYVLAENRNRRAAYGPHKIAWRPQVTLALADTPERRDSREFLLHAPRRDAFE